MSSNFTLEGQNTYYKYFFHFELVAMLQSISMTYYVYEICSHQKEPHCVY